MKNQKLLIIPLTIIVIIVIGFIIFVARNNRLGKDFLNDKAQKEQNEINVPIGLDPRDSSYIIENELVTLVNGRAERELVVGSGEKITAEISGEIARGDLNDDGYEDAVLLLAINMEERETFYYLAAAIKQKDGGYQGTNAIRVGDRIIPKDLYTASKSIVFNYTDGLPDEAAADAFIIGKAFYASLDNNALKEIKTNNEFFNTKTLPPYSVLFSPVTIIGEANFLEGNVRIRIKDKAGNILADTSVKASGSGDGLYGFEKIVEFSQATEGEGVVEFFEESGEKGEENKKIIIPVFFNDYAKKAEENPLLKDFDDCVKARNPIVDGFPRECHARNGMIYIEEAKEGMPPVGGETDDHGCLGPAGYAWDETLGACARSWEMNETVKPIAKIAIDEVGQADGLTVVEVRADECDSCFTVTLQQDQEKRMEIEIKNEKAVKVNTIDLEQKERE